MTLAFSFIPGHANSVLNRASTTASDEDIQGATLQSQGIGLY